LAKPHPDKSGRKKRETGSSEEVVADEFTPNISFISLLFEKRSA